MTKGIVISNLTRYQTEMPYLYLHGTPELTCRGSLIPPTSHAPTVSYLPPNSPLNSVSPSSSSNSVGSSLPTNSRFSLPSTGSSFPTIPAIQLMSPNPIPSHSTSPVSSALITSSNFPPPIPINAISIDLPLLHSAHLILATLSPPQNSHPMLTRSKTNSLPSPHPLAFLSLTSISLDSRGPFLTRKTSVIPIG
ncbi:hypothetical protein U1Q18_026115 [Sarracenia purpurea var. burkii]